MELNIFDLPQGMSFTIIDESETGIGLYIPCGNLGTPAKIKLSMLVGKDYLGKRKVCDFEVSELDSGYLFWFTDEGRRFMDEYRRFADLLNYLGMGAGKKTGAHAGQSKELPQLDDADLSSLAFYNDRVNNIYVPMRGDKADLKLYPLLARLEKLGLLDISLDDADDAPQPERFFRISVTDKGREVLRRRREKNRD